MLQLLQLYPAKAQTGTRIGTQVHRVEAELDVRHVDDAEMIDSGNEVWSDEEWTDDIEEFTIRFLNIHTKLTQREPSAFVQSFIRKILETGYLDFSGIPSTKEEAQAIMSYATACAEVKPYLQYFPPLSPWKDIAGVVDEVFLSEDDFPCNPFVWCFVRVSNAVASVL